MNLQTKRKIDHFLGTPFLLATHVVARFLGSILRRNHRLNPVRRILVAKFQGMGSLAIAKPALERLRKAYPDARIIFWGTGSTCALARLMPEIDEVIVLDDGGLMTSLGSLIGNLRQIWRAGPDWAFDFEVYSKLSSVLITLTCARNRAAFAVSSVPLRENSYTHLVLFNRYEYLGNAYQALLGILLAAPVRNASLSHGGRRWKMDMLPVETLPDRYIVVNPQAGPLSLERRWPSAYFKALLNYLLEAYPDTSVVLVGHGREEIEYLADFPDHPRVIKAAGKLSLEEMIRCLAHARLTVSNDTGPLHLALCADRPVVALFGPTHPAAYLDPTRANTVSFAEKLYCSPCVHHWEPSPCLGDNQCMKRIQVADVARACVGLLGVPAVPVERIQAPASQADPSYFAGMIYQRVPVGDRA